MAEQFTDEELAEAGLDDPAIRLGATIARLQRERDEARRVAKVLAQRTTASQHDWAEVMTALDYPEVKP